MTMSDRGEVRLPVPQQPALEMAWLDPADIDANPHQPRQVFDEDALAELAESIRGVGLLQPLLVRPHRLAPNDAAGPQRWVLVAGERRLRASRMVGLDKVPVLIRHTEDAELLRLALLENVQREQLNPMEEAAAYRQMLDDFGFTHEELAARLGKSRSSITQMVGFLRLPTDVQRKVASGVVLPGHARLLGTLEDPEKISKVATRVVAEGLTVRQLQEVLAFLPGEERARRGPRPRRPLPEFAAEAASSLSDRLDTRVRVEAGSKRGRLIVDFAGADDLERILALLTPAHGGQRGD